MLYLGYIYKSLSFLLQPVSYDTPTAKSFTCSHAVGPTDKLKKPLEGLRSDGRLHLTRTNFVQLISQWGG